MDIVIIILVAAGIILNTSLMFLWIKVGHLYWLHDQHAAALKSILSALERQREDA